jgi:hypothetical protein
MNRMPFLLLALVALMPADPACSTELPAQAMADRMLSALGGRDPWAALTSLVNDSQQNRAGEPPVVQAVITMDLQRTRFRIETTGPNLRLIRVVDGERHWRLNREGIIEPVPADVLADDRQWHAGHVYRTIHRVAGRDPALSLVVGADGRLEVHEAGKRIAWYKLDVRGEPYAYGAHADDTGSIFGPWDFHESGIRHPLWVSSPDGTWRARIQSLKVNVPLDDALFAEPSTGDARRAVNAGD